jgi:isoleucyl-tRNA synthetase
MFKDVNATIPFSKREDDVTSYWKENGIFEKSVSFRPDDKKWTFLDGPPFVTGMPHYGSLLSSLPKDLFGRYWTMKGYKVRRVWGWDGHGLPIENKVEGKLHIKRKRDIEEIVGVDTFISECKKYVEEVSGEWEWYVDKIGRWVDFKNAYRTWDMSYMESVMWVFSKMYKGGHIYKGLRVSLYCPHCSTPISNFEVAMDQDNYKEIVDAATTYKYELEGEKNTYILSWSTTPWNKIVTPALAVNPNLTYIKVKQGEENYILAKSTIKMLKADPKYEIIEEFMGKDLIGKKFVPHFDYYRSEIKDGENAFVLIGGDFVTSDEGTGVVTIAVYGEEDLKAMQENNIHMQIHLDEEGTILPDVPMFGGMYYLDANRAVNDELMKRGLIYEDKPLPHNVPHCWRCATRLYYSPQNAWYVNISNMKDKLKETNKKINWFPHHFKNGRFAKSIESAPDWNISRSRYWGSPVPVWECQCGERYVPESIKELEQMSDMKVEDLHKPYIDNITIKCKKCDQVAKRVPEVLDSWIEAGSASFAERHFPFDESQKLEDFFPPDFIAEYTGQIRAWFYVLHVIGAALYDSPAFKNVVVEGVILGTDGRKMSKNYGNFPDPKKLIDMYGGDALRMYLLGSPVMNGEDIRISEIDYRDQVRGTLLILWNAYNFFITYANIDGWTPTANSQQLTANSQLGVLDKWILSRLNRLVLEVTNKLDNYDTAGAISLYKKFVTEFSTWYIRRSRDRVGPSSIVGNDRNNFYSTCYEVLTILCKVIAPITPFIAESMFRNLTTSESVHLEDWPIVNKAYIDTTLEDEMVFGQDLASVISSFRKDAGVKVKIPFKKLTYSGHKLSEEVVTIIKEETNVEELEFGKELDKYTIEGVKDISNQNIEAGEARDIIRSIQQKRKELGTTMTQMVTVSLPAWPKSFEEEIKRKALVSNLKVADTFSVETV